MTTPRTNVNSDRYKYEVVQVMHDGAEMVIGWTNATDGGLLASSFGKHPDTLRIEVREWRPTTPPMAEPPR